jgi:hypothetical protein
LGDNPMPDARERTKVQRWPRDHSSHRGGPRRGAPDALGAPLPKRALESVGLAGSVGLLVLGGEVAGRRCCFGIPRSSSSQHFRGMLLCCMLWYLRWELDNLHQFTSVNYVQMTYQWNLQFSKTDARFPTDGHGIGLAELLILQMMFLALDLARCSFCPPRQNPRNWTSQLGCRPRGKWWLESGRWQVAGGFAHEQTHTQS